MLCVNQTNIAELVSQAATMRGSKSRSSKWHQRAEALANSRPIRPQPMTPKLMMRLLISSQHLQRLLRCGLFVNNRHQGTSDASWRWMLNYITPVDNPTCALLHEDICTLDDDFI